MKKYTFWFVVGSQFLYGPEVLETVDKRAAEMAAELSRVLDRFLRKLPERECCIFLRRYWYLDSAQAIAQRFHMTEGSVKSQLFRTRTKLRTCLEKEGICL